MLNRVTRNIFRILLIISLSVSAAFAQMLILSPAENFVTNLNRIAVSVMGKPSAEAKLFLNDELVSTGRIRVDGVFDFLNVEAPDGPVSLRVEAKGALDRLYTAERNIHVLGPAKEILPYEDKIELPAGGKDSKTIKYEVRDEWGYRLEHLKVATVELEKGTILNEDIDSLTAGTQIFVNDGVIEIEIRSAESPGRAILRTEIMGEAFDQTVRYTTAKHPFIVVGSVSGAAGNYQDFGGSDDTPDVEEWRQDSTSIFGMPVMGGGRAALIRKRNDL